MNFDPNDFFIFFLLIYRWIVVHVKSFEISVVAAVIRFENYE